MGISSKDLGNLALCGQQLPHEGPGEQTSAAGAAGARRQQRSAGVVECRAVSLTATGTALEQLWLPGVAAALCCTAGPCWGWALRCAMASWLLVSLDPQHAKKPFCGMLLGWAGLG